MEFNLALAVLYARKLKEASSFNTEGSLESLTEPKAKIVYQLLEKNFFNRLQLALALLSDLTITTESEAFSYLLFEINLYKKISNCLLSGERLEYTDSEARSSVNLDERELMSSYKTRLIAAHGLRWGWQIQEFKGQYLILDLLDQSYFLRGNSCSCRRADCSHLNFARYVIANRAEFNFVISTKNYAQYFDLASES